MSQEFAFDALTADQPVMARVLEDVLGLRCKLWYGGIGRHPYQDNWLMTAQDGVVRLGVVDGATGWDDQQAPVAAAARAKAALEGSLGAPLTASALAANGMLHDPSVEPGRQVAVAMAAVEVWGQDGGVGALAVRAGDCEVWVETEAGWGEVFAGDMLEEGARAEFEDWKMTHKGAPHSALAAFEAQLLAPAEAWRTAPLGRYGAGKLEWALLPKDWRGLVLASDGARLQADVLGDLEGWLEGLRARELARKIPGDDVVVLRVQRA